LSRCGCWRRSGWKSRGGGCGSGERRRRGGEAVAEATTFIYADREQFSLHPEDDMTESRSHSAQAVYLEFAISQALPELFVARNLAVYWVPGQREHPYAGPDVLVSRHHPQRQEDPTVYLTYEDGPLTLVAEIASDKTRRKERRKRDEIYGAALQ